MSVQADSDIEVLDWEMDRNMCEWNMYKVFQISSYDEDNHSSDLKLFTLT